MPERSGSCSADPFVRHRFSVVRHRGLAARFATPSSGEDGGEKMRFTRLAMVAAAMLGGCAASQLPAPTGPASEARAVAGIVDPLIEAERSRSGMPGAAFIFVRGGRVVYQRGYGV